MESRYSLRSPAVKRLMKEAQELRSPTEDYFTQPLDDNLFEWHFTVRGPPETDFDQGFYHGRIILPPDYPMKPPSIIILTPNGRFETNRKICLSISGHHPESWQPSWSIRTALLAIIGFMPTHGNGAIGSLDYTPKERKTLALSSQTWKCPTCGSIKDKLLNGTNNDSNEEAKLLATQMSMNAPKDSKPDAEAQEQDSAGDTELRQRQISPQADTIIQEEQQHQPAQALHTVPDYNPITEAVMIQNIASQNLNSFRNFQYLMAWVLAAILTLLVIRRLFFL